MSDNETSTTSGTTDAADFAAQRRGLAASLLTLLALLGAVELGFRQSYLGRRLAGENLYAVKADTYSRSPGYDVAIVGDSRVMHGIDPRAVERVLREETGRSISVWNAGLSGAPPMAHLAWVARLLSHAHRPHTVVLSISPNMFGTLLPDPPSRESLTAVYRLQDLPAVYAAGASSEDLAHVAAVNAFSLMRFRTRALSVMLTGAGLRPQVNAGVQGFGPLAPVDAATQDRRARHRLLGYANEMHRMSARFGNEQVGYFTECLRRLRDAGVRTIVMNSPSSSQLEAAYGPESFYRQHMTFVRRMAREYGAGWIDAQHDSPLTDADFTDGDHLSYPGAARLSEWLAREHLAPVLR